MRRAPLFAWTLALGALATVTLLLIEGAPVPGVSTMLFWILLLIAAELLPVSLGFESRITMGFPIGLAVAILYHPAIAMIIVGFSLDIREIRRELPIWRVAFNHAQLMLAAGAASGLIHLTYTTGRTDEVFTFPEGAIVLIVATMAYESVNLGVVSVMLKLDHGLSLGKALEALLPRPLAGFLVAQAALAAMGAATAAVYERLGAYVAAFLIPLLFARMGILGARAQQELSERIQKQQQALLRATEKVFQEREDERKRIAEHIHDSSLQMLAAASYGVSNTEGLVAAGRTDKAVDVLHTTQRAIDGAILALRQSLVDLRRSSVEEGGLAETIRKFAGEVSTLWDAEVHVEGSVDAEPPIPVALAAFQIVQEGLVNSLKHAGTDVFVKMSSDNGVVRITVEDSGQGFDPTEEVGSEHIGVRTMKERAEQVGGSIEFDSEPGRGTKLQVLLPSGVTQ